MRTPWPAAALLIVGLIASACVGSEASAPTTIGPVATVPPAVSTTAVSATTGSATTAQSSNTPPDSTALSVPATTTAAPLGPLVGVQTELIAEVHRPVVVVPDPIDGTLLVVDQAGIISRVAADGAVSVFFDLTDRVGATGIEQGLLGFALGRDYPDDGKFYVYYTDQSDDSHLVEFTNAEGVIDPDLGRELLFVEQPTNRHNAGTIVFGPDGYLWLSLGEGGAASANAQNPETLLGSILRIAITSTEPYDIPASNPFVDGGGAAEVWAYGLRNPWKFSIDPAERLMYIGDVGHSEWEEIDVVSIDTDAGANFGWLPMEGSRCFLDGCDPSAFTLPTVEYSHDGGNCSVTGGIVYRGAAIPEFNGAYFYADWCGGWIRSFRYVAGEATDHQDWTEQLGNVGQVTSFGVDADGELLFTTWDGGIYRLLPVRG